MWKKKKQYKGDSFHCQKNIALHQTVGMHHVIPIIASIQLQYFGASKPNYKKMEKRLENGQDITWNYRMKPNFHLPTASILLCFDLLQFRITCIREESEVKSIKIWKKKRHVNVPIAIGIATVNIMPLIAPINFEIVAYPTKKILILNIKGKRVSTWSSRWSIYKTWDNWKIKGWLWGALIESSTRSHG